MSNPVAGFRRVNEAGLVEEWKADFDAVERYVPLWDRPGVKGPFRVRGILILTTPDGSTDGGILRGKNPKDGQNYDLLQFGPEQELRIGTSRGPVHCFGHWPEEIIRTRIYENWTWKHTAAANDPNHTYETAGTGTVSFPTTLGYKAMRASGSAHNDRVLLQRPGFVCQGGYDFRMDWAIREQRENNANPGNKELAFGLTANLADPLDPSSKGIFFYRTNADGTGFGTTFVRVQNGQTVVDTALDDYGVKVPSYAGVTIYVMSLVPGDGVVTAWMGDSGNLFNPANSGNPDASAPINTATDFTASDFLMPFFHQKVVQAAGDPGTLHTYIKSYEAIRRHF